MTVVMATLTKRPRLQCPLCKETLSVSYSAFYRHQQTKSCVALNARNDEPSDVGDFVEGLCSSDPPPGSPPLHSDPSDSSSSSSGEESDIAPEIWEVESESDNEAVSDSHSEELKIFQYISKLFPAILPTLLSCI